MNESIAASIVDAPNIVIVFLLLYVFKKWDKAFR
jgi:hypothetical protein